MDDPRRRVPRTDTLLADPRRVKGFGYKTFKRLEPFLDIKGETTLK